MESRSEGQREESHLPIRKLITFHYNALSAVHYMLTYNASLLGLTTSFILQWDMGYSFSFLVVSLSGFGIRVMLAQFGHRPVGVNKALWEHSCAHLFP